MSKGIRRGGRGFLVAASSRLAVRGEERLQVAHEIRLSVGEVGRLLASASRSYSCLGGSAFAAGESAAGRRLPRTHGSESASTTGRRPAGEMASYVGSFPFQAFYSSQTRRSSAENRGSARSGSMVGATLSCQIRLDVSWCARSSHVKA